MKKEEALKVFRSYKIWDLMDNFTTDELQEMIDEIVSTPSIPSNLDEAAEKYSESILANNEDLQDAIEDAFIAGAEWMAGQYKTLGETEIYLEDDGGEAPYTQEWLDLATTEFAVPEGFKPGDKVIVQIRKKQ